MNPRDMYDLVVDVCGQYRKCEEAEQTVIENGVKVTHIWNMPYFKEAADNHQLIDVHFQYIGVDEEKALARKREFIELIRTYNPQAENREVGYIELGAVLGHQELAFMVFAVGEVLGVWRIHTPERVLGFMRETEGANVKKAESVQALMDQAAGMGLITVNWPRVAA